MSKRILLLDCDGVIFDSVRLIDEQVKQIEYCASDEYYQNLVKKSEILHNRLHEREEERTNDLEGILSQIKYLSELRKGHFYFKDLVLEEAMPEYENQINYFKVYQIENTYPEVIDFINNVAKTNVFEKICILSHVNCVNEIIAKTIFFRKYLPMVELYFPSFHFEPFFRQDGSVNTDRKRANKILYFMKTSEIDDLSNTVFIDDTEGIVNEAIQLGVGFPYHKTKREDSLSVIKCACEEQYANIENIKSRIKKI